MSSVVSSDTEINSSPLVIHEDGTELSISSKVRNRRQKRPKVVDDETDDVSLWSEAKRQSWSAINTNPNAFFYRHCAPGEQKRNGAWDAHEKKLFLETMKVHPPSQGRWGLFAQHIPGRVGYQCRNFYHRLLESGEIKALPGELEKIQRKRKTSTKQSPRPKIKINEEPEFEPDEPTFSQDEKETSSTSDSEEITLNQVKKITFSSKAIEKLKEKGEDLSQKTFFEDASDSSPSDSCEFEVITYLDNDLQAVHSPIKLQENNEEIINKLDEDEKEPIIPVISEDIPHKQEPESSLKWTPRMQQPWKTLTPQQIEKLKSKRNQPFEYESSKILKSNLYNPLNLVLFSLNAGNRSLQYASAIKEHLLNDDQSTKNELLRRYFHLKNDGEIDDFVNYVIETAK